ncbi:hypothetical protein [Apis mellifera associated microvirus 42]|nr:hypothetical protein [Apis mellifera associated microvirus 42]
MAKSRNRTGRRGNNTTQTTAIRTRMPLPTVALVTLSHTTYPDRRTWSPARVLSGPAARNVNATRLVAADRVGDAVRRQTKAPIRFAVPEKVALCVRRQRRKEVLHAFKKAGRKGPQKKHHRNQWSNVSCKR